MNFMLALLDPFEILLQQLLSIQRRLFCLCSLLMRISLQIFYTPSVGLDRTLVILVPSFLLYDFLLMVL